MNKIDESGLFQSGIQSLPLVYRGKVRDSYAVSGDQLLIVTTDRLSAFDVVMRQPIPDKGKVLNAMSNFWFEKLAHVTPNHLTGIAPESVVAGNELDQVRGRAVVAMKLKPLPVEAVVRGYLIGSGWKDYQRGGSVCGIELPRGLQMASKLPEPLFTPANKAELGTHDENISFERMQQIVGADQSCSLFGRDRVCRHARHHHCRHQVRIWHRRERRLAIDGRGADGRLVAFLAGGPVR